MIDTKNEERANNLKQRQLKIETNLKSGIFSFKFKLYSINLFNNKLRVKCFIQKKEIQEGTQFAKLKKKQ